MENYNDKSMSRVKLNVKFSLKNPNFRIPQDYILYGKDHVYNVSEEVLALKYLWTNKFKVMGDTLNVRKGGYEFHFVSNETKERVVFSVPKMIIAEVWLNEKIISIFGASSRLLDSWNVNAKIGSINHYCYFFLDIFDEFINIDESLYIATEDVPMAIKRSGINLESLKLELA